MTVYLPLKVSQYRVAGMIGIDDGHGATVAAADTMEAAAVIVAAVNAWYGEGVTRTRDMQGMPSA